MNLRIRITSVAFLAASATVAGAQQRPPVRQLGAVVAKSTETFVNAASVRALSNGSVLVNDVGGRRVLLFNPALSSFTVIADSTSATANAYAGRTGSLIAYRGDSSLFIDPTSVSMLVIDAAGKVARVMAIPRAEDALMIGGTLGNSAFDASGRLVYRAGARFQMVGRGAGGPGGFTMPDPPDSALILRVDLTTRHLDTLGFIRTPKIKLDVKRDDRGNISVQSMINPLPVVDDWAVTSDGAVAFVRGRDYHVDWVNSDGSKTSSAKIPFDWQRMTDEDKIAFIDSLKAARERLGANAPVPTGGGAPPGAGGGTPQVMIFAGPGGPGGGPGAGGGLRTGPNGALQPPSFVPANELPDYKPPFFAGSTRADTDGNLWIRTIPTSAIAGGPVYDVVNRTGEIVERVQIPVGRSIVGFGPGGAVYLLNRDGTTTTLEKATVR
ncbi:MAG: hypothetical protein Q7S20_10010 [Gemmatimonadaceae bacterium]|nr:hypothetical protein [Gemmatimonadaceae bacterium]